MISVIGSLKGGSGKSTIAFNLSIWLANTGSSVLCIDADPQATLTDALDVRSEEGYQPLLEPAKADLLADRNRLNEADEVVIDIGTASMDNLRNAVAVADRVIVPVPPSQADIWSTQRFIRFVKSVAYGREPELIGFINRGDTHRAVRESDEAAAALVSLPGIRFIPPRLAQRTVFRRAFSEGLAVFEQDPRGKATTEWNNLVAALYPHLLR